MSLLLLLYSDHLVTPPLFLPIYLKCFHSSFLMHVIQIRNPLCQDVLIFPHVSPPLR
jgi:hypothetical protein